MYKSKLRSMIDWYKEEVRANQYDLEEGKRKVQKLEQELQQAKRTVPVLEAKLNANKQKLDRYTQELGKMETEEKRR